MKTKIARLGQLEKSQSQFKQAKLELSSLNQAGKKFKRIYFKPTLSNCALKEFHFVYFRLDEFRKRYKLKNAEIRKSVNEELKRLESQILVVKEKLS